MAEYGIWVDASADLDKDYLKDAQIGVLPMEYTLGDERQTADGGETPEKMHVFYDAQRKGDLTHTSQITPALYREMFNPEMEKEDVLYLALSSGLTKTVESAEIAREKLERDHPHRIEVVDTLSATCGIGLLAEKAVENREKGMGLAENAAALRELSNRVCHVFMVEDLMYLKKGGRLGGAAAVVGTVMGIKPILIIDRGGKLTTVERTRGQKAAEKEMLRLFKLAHEGNEDKRVFITHGDALPHALSLKERVAQEDPTLKISVHTLCPVIGAHTGPGMVSLVFFGDRKKLGGL